MPRSARAALGSYTTPFGIAHFCVERQAGVEKVGLRARGGTQCLRWLFPKKPIKDHQQKLLVILPDSDATVTGVETLHQELIKAWNIRLAREPGTWSARPGPLGSAEPSQVTLSDLIRRMEAQAASHVRASTLTTYRFEWQQLLRLIPPNTAVGSVSTGMLLDTVNHLRRNNAAAETIRKHIAQVKRVFKFAVTEGLITTDPAASIKLPKVPKNLPRFLSQDERDRLLGVAETKGRDYHLLVALGVFLGLRKAELNSLRWQDLDWNQNVAHVVNTANFTTKSGKPRTVPITDDLLDILRRYREAAGFVLAPRKNYRPGARYRWEFREIFAQMVIDAKLDPRLVTPHVLRHTFASILAQRGVSLYKIGAWMGHTTAEVTELYAHLTAFDEDISRLNRPAPTEKSHQLPPAITPA